jgi:hypothetical protein
MPSIRILIAVAAGVLAASAPATAAAPGLAKYRGMHPLPPHAGDFCYIDVPHVHRATPSDMRVYATLPSQEVVFVGDPVALGYTGPKHAYFGPHPLAHPDVPASDNVVCYYLKAHYHAHRPAAGTTFTQKDGAYWYTGAFPPDFEKQSYLTRINQTAPIPGYKPPAVELGAAPPGYKLPVLAPPPAPLVQPDPAAPKGRAARKPAKADKAGAEKGGAP